MLKLFSAFRKNKIWDFNGGIHPPEMKTQSNGTPLRQVPLAQRFVIPLKQHIGAEGELCVSVGDKVLRGQPLTRGRGKMLPVHAPTSGTVTAIAPHSTAHPSALAELSVIIDADGEDCWIPRDGWADYRTRSREELIERIHQFGVAGLGGAGFPTGVKLQGGGDKIETLIINAAECEPYITADDRLMQDCAAQVVEGIRILAHILQPREILIGIEDNKPQAISMLRAVLADSNDISLRVIPTKYPSGGAKQLTYILTGKQVPHGGRSSDIGVLMQNVGTAYAVKRAVIDGEPITERVVTLTGEAIARPGNVWARLGTPVRHLLNDAGFCPSADQMVIMGGPLMGFTLPWLDVPVVKITNCLLAPSANELGEPQEEQSCIRCSACADACPADLLPQQLYWFRKGQQHDKATTHNIADCIECGACAWVCPSNIPLVQYFRQEKAEIAAIRQEEKRAAEAKARFEARQARLEREKAARLERHKSAAVQPAAKDKDAIAAALARVKEKQAQAEALAAEIGGWAVQADVADPVQVGRMVDNVLDKFCQLDILICNAGIAQQKLFGDLTDDDWRRMFAVNVDGVFHAVRAALPHFIHRKAGRIVTVSSMWGQVGGSCEVAYSAAKAAVIGLTRALAKELGPSGITVNCVSPGVISTEMNAHLDQEALAALAEETPLGAIGTPEDVAEAIWYLSSDAARFVTGQVLAPNGGLVI